MKHLNGMRITLWERLRLIFVRSEVSWDHEVGLVSKFKRMDGKMYVIRQEPIAHGDPRNAQIGRFS